MSRKKFLELGQDIDWYYTKVGINALFSSSLVVNRHIEATRWYFIMHKDKIFMHKMMFVYRYDAYHELMRFLRKMVRQRIRMIISCKNTRKWLFKPLLARMIAKNIITNTYSLQYFKSHDSVNYNVPFRWLFNTYEKDVQLRKDVEACLQEG